MATRAELLEEEARLLERKKALLTPTNPVAAFANNFSQSGAMNFSDEISGVMEAATRAPFSDRTFGEIYDEQTNMERDRLEAARAQHPIASTLGSIAGAFATGAGLARRGLSLAAKANTIPQAIGLGATEGAIYGGASGAGAADEGERLQGAATGAAVGAATGGAIGGGAAALARSRIPVPPQIDELRQQSKAAYQAAEQAGVTISRNSWQSAVNRIESAAKKAGIDPDLHPAASAALRRLTQSGNKDLTFEQADTLRQVVGDAMNGTSPREQRMAGIIMRQLDRFIENMQPSDVLTGDARVANAAIGQARDLWARGAKASIVEDLIERAGIRAGQFSGSGYENALRTEFRQLALNKARMSRFNANERRAIERVARGGPIANLLRFIGKAAPRGIVSTSLAGGAGYAVGGPVGAGVVLGAGEIGRAGATALTRRNAALASELMRRGATRPPLQISPSVVPLITGTNEAIDEVVE